jgi:hypothetical protein
VWKLPKPLPARYRIGPFHGEHGGVLLGEEGQFLNSVNIMGNESVQNCCSAKLARQSSLESTVYEGIMIQVRFIILQFHPPLVEDTPRAPAIACQTRARASLLIQPLAVQANACPSTLCRARHIVKVSTHWAPSWRS